MNIKPVIAVICMFLFLLIYSCATPPPVSTGNQVEQEIVMPVPVEQPAEEIVEIIPQKIPPAKEDAPETLNDEELKEAETDIAELIEKLNKIIESKDFTGWIENLSNHYISHYSDPVILAEQSSSPLLSKNKIVLRTIEDYFNYVVVGSRQNIRLDEIKTIDRNRLRAYMYINNTPVIIYELIRLDNIWKIDIF